jgi:hypothetical protein
MDNLQNVTNIFHIELREHKNHQLVNNAKKKFKKMVYISKFNS